MVSVVMPRVWWDQTSTCRRVTWRGHDWSRGLWHVMHRKSCCLIIVSKAINWWPDPRSWPWLSQVWPLSLTCTTLIVVTPGNYCTTLFSFSMNSICLSWCIFSHPVCVIYLSVGPSSIKSQSHSQSQRLMGVMVMTLNFDLTFPRPTPETLSR